MKLKYFIFVMAAFVAVSCQKEVSPVVEKDNNSNLRKSDLLLNYYNFLQQQTNGTVKVSGYATLYTQDKEDRNFDATGAFSGQSSNFSEVKIDNILLNRGNNGIFENKDSKSLYNIYGKSVSFSFKEQGNLVEQNLYIPLALNLSLDYNPNTFEVPLKVGTQIKWNADNQNSRGVVIILDYNPRTNYSNIVQEAPNPITKVIGVDDSGSYVLTEEDLDGIPNKASVTLSVGRAGFAIKTLPSSSKSYSFYGLTLVDAGATIVK